MSILPKIVKKSKKSSFSKSDNSAGVGRKYDFWPEIHRIRLVKHSWTIIHTSDIILHHFAFESKFFFSSQKMSIFKKKNKFWPIHLFVNLWCHILTLMWVCTYILEFFHHINSGPYQTSFLGIHSHFWNSGHFQNPHFFTFLSKIT